MGQDKGCQQVCALTPQPLRGHPHLSGRQRDVLSLEPFMVTLEGSKFTRALKKNLARTITDCLSHRLLETCSFIPCQESCSTAAKGIIQAQPHDSVSSVSWKFNQSPTKSKYKWHFLAYKCERLDWFNSCPTDLRQTPKADLRVQSRKPLLFRL